MSEQTIVAAFDAADHADAAILALKTAKVPSEAISRSVQNNLVVASIKVPGQYAELVGEILDRHNPVDLDERAATESDSGSIKLFEEALSIGKRVNQGTTRIRRYSVEVPVEEDVTLHSEKVVVERRPVNESRPASDADFSDKVVEMSESSEEVVVGKTARVKEEISLRKEAGEHVETVKDSVRHQEVEVERVPGMTQATTTKPAPRR